MAWPILLMLSALSWTSSPSGPNASSSKKHQMPDPESMNSRLLVRSCSSVVKIVRSALGTKASTISSARWRSALHASGVAKSSMARKPSRW
jgi:hypothetical protein